MDDKLGSADDAEEELKDGVDHKDKSKETSAMNVISGKKRQRSEEDESSIDSSSEDDEPKQKSKRHKAK